MKKSQLALGLLSLVTMLPAFAATQDIAVTAAGDRVYYRDWYYGGSDRGWIVDANPNQVSHSYTPGDGRSRETALTFDLTSAQAIPVDDITSITFNYNIESIWTEGRDDVANLNDLGTVLASGGTGWKSFDVTTRVKSALGAHQTAADFYFSYTGWSGFTFSSAEGGNPAFLRITTLSASAVPEPDAYALLLAGLGVVGAVSLRRKQAALR